MVPPHIEVDMFEGMTRAVPAGLGMLFTLCLLPSCRLTIGPGDGGWGGDVVAAGGSAGGDAGGGGTTGETGLKDIPCAVTGCGDGKCTWCPDIFPDLSSLIVKSWCSYTCIKDWQYIVGLKIRLNLALDGVLEGCYRFSKPIPCDGGSECFPNMP